MAEDFSLPPEFTPLLEGIEVIRGKAFGIALWATLIFIGVYSISEEMILWLRDELVPEGASIILLSPVELILLKIKLASISAMVAALPPVAYLLWRHARENLDVQLDFELGWLGGVLMLIASGLLFVAGVTYSIGFMLPLLLDYLYTDAHASGLEVTYSLGEFLHFTLMLTVALGLGFQLPLVVWLLIKGEITTYSQLAQYRRHVFMVFFILAALITPPDVVSQLVLAIPMAGLFEISLVMMRLVDRDRFLEDQGLALDRETPYAPRAVILMALYGLLQWVLAVVLMCGLLYYARDNQWAGIQASWLLDRQELLDNTPWLIIPPVLATLAILALGLAGRLNYRGLTALRPPVYLACMLMVAWITPSNDPWPYAFILLAVPVLAGFELTLTLFRGAAIHPLPQARMSVPGETSPEESDGSKPSEPASDPPSPEKIVKTRARLEQIRDLRERGQLDKDEYEMARQKIIEDEMGPK